MAEVKIKKLKENDIEVFNKVFESAINRDFDFFPKKARKEFLKDYSITQLKKLINKDKGMILVAKNKERIIGFIIADEPWGGLGFIAWLIIEPGYRKKGIGSALLKKLEEESEKSGCHKLHLIANLVKDKDPSEFYKKLGYFEEGISKNHFFNLDICRFAKFINTKD